MKPSKRKPKAPAKVAKAASAKNTNTNTATRSFLPVPRAQDLNTAYWKESYSIEDPKKLLMLAALAETGNKTISARVAGIVKKTHYNWMGGKGTAEDDITTEQKIYRAAVEEADESGADVLEWLLRLMSFGKAKGNHVAAFFLLKGLRPQIYRERFEHMGPAGGALPAVGVAVQIVQQLGTPERIQEIINVAKKSGLLELMKPRIAQITAEIKALEVEGESGNGSASNGH